MLLFFVANMSNSDGIALALFACSPLRVLGATTTILLTTMVDTIWLVPFVAQAPTRNIAVEHGTIYLLSYVALTSTVSLATFAFREGLSSTTSTEATSKVDVDEISSAVGALLCWILAGLLFYKAWLKKHAIVINDQSEGSGDANGTEGLLEMAQTHNDPTGSSRVIDSGAADELISTDEGSDQSGQPWMVMTLTIAGSFDEVSYYPSLILGNVFSVTELIIGTVVAALVMLVVVTMFLTQCQPVLNLIDRIPLYLVVTLFAILITGELLWDMIM
jgi:hypothetical protein